MSQTPQPPPLQGCVVIDKPLGWSSMDVVRRARGALRGGRKLKVGHAGTLDPLATGVLVLCVGKATSLVERLMDHTKIYDAEIDLSAFTTTDDREGTRQEIAVAAPPDETTLRRALDTFIGDIRQTPPAFSAIHIDGRRAYDLARNGETVEIPSRVVHIDAIELLAYTWPIAKVRVTCGRGTYIRSLARDLGRSLGTGGHLASLRRLAVGKFTIDQAIQPQELTPEKLIVMEHVLAEN